MVLAKVVVMERSGQEVQVAALERSDLKVLRGQASQVPRDPTEGGV